MKTLVITGGIGSGKSAVCRYLETKGVPVYYSDVRTKALYAENPVLVDDIEEAMGESVRDSGGVLSRRKLGSIVFSDPAKLKALEDIVHPFVVEDFIRWRNDRFDGPSPFVVMESAIFMDRPIFRSIPDKVMLVDAPLEERIRRAMERDESTREQILRRISAQKINPSDADVVIENDCSLETLYERVDEALKTIWK